MSDHKSDDLWTEFSCTTMDGLTIRGRHYGSRSLKNTPVVYLPGLSRSIRDFEETAFALSQDPQNPRRVLSLNYRGRGTSDYDENWRNYTPAIEAGDALNAIIAAGLHNVVVFGTSRGGIIAMLLGAMRPAILRGVVLHDIGPSIDMKGLIRIKSYLTQMPPPKNWDDAADVLKTVHRGHFPDFADLDWHKSAELTFAKKEGRPSVDYDPALLNTLKNITSDTIAPSLWPQFKSLCNTPLLAIRGGLSDLLSVETFEEMRRLHPMMRSVTVPNQGHVPSLTGHETMSAIQSFLAELDSNNAH